MLLKEVYYTLHLFNQNYRKSDTDSDFQQHCKQKSFIFFESWQFNAVWMHLSITKCKTLLIGDREQGFSWIALNHSKQINIVSTRIQSKSFPQMICLHSEFFLMLQTFIITRQNLSNPLYALWDWKTWSINCPSPKIWFNFLRLCYLKGVNQTLKNHLESELNLKARSSLKPKHAHNSSGL